MIIEIKEFEKKYTFNLEKITQLCGQNIRKKSYILESIRKYFSTYKYREEDNKWRDNVFVEGENVGRKFFEAISINSKNDILTHIKWSKQSLISEYVKQLMEQFDWQSHLQIIDEEIETMFCILNEDVRKLGNIELTYSSSDVWDMVQKTEIIRNNQNVVEECDNYELIDTFLNLLEKVMEKTPRKLIIVFENADHLLTKEEYKKIIKKLCVLGSKYNIYFILTTSLNGYVVCEKEVFEGITIFNDIDFQMPELNYMLEFINDNYPYYKENVEENMRKELENIIQKIGIHSFIESVEETVIIKLINRTLSIDDKWQHMPKTAEVSFLLD